MNGKSTITKEHKKYISCSYCKIKLDVVFMRCILDTEGEDRAIRM